NTLLSTAHMLFYFHRPATHEISTLSLHDALPIFQARYEVNISETYGRVEGSTSGGLDNCTDKVQPRVRAALPPLAWQTFDIDFRSEEHTSELQSRGHLVCRLLLEKKK